MLIFLPPSSIPLLGQLEVDSKLEIRFSFHPGAVPLQAEIKIPSFIHFFSFSI
jgi:hypothetical protein